MTDERFGPQTTNLFLHMPSRLLPNQPFCGVISFRPAINAITTALPTPTKRNQARDALQPKKLGTHTPDRLDEKKRNQYKEGKIAASTTFIVTQAGKRTVSAGP
jgi:hypothetical protein